MPWLALTFEIDAAHAEAFGDALLEAGADSVSLEDADAGGAAEVPRYAEPSPHTAYGEFALEQAPVWPRNRLSALVAEAADPAALAAAAAAAAGLPGVPPYTVARVADDDWVRRTQSQFAPLKIADRLWIVPSWHEPPEADAIAIRLDPGLAFGTGSHPTTRLALRFLARSLRDSPRGAGWSVLEYGCGSGILAARPASVAGDARQILARDDRVIVLYCRCRGEPVPRRRDGNRDLRRKFKRIDGRRSDRAHRPYAARRYAVSLYCLRQQDCAGRRRPHRPLRRA